MPSTPRLGLTLPDWCAIAGYAALIVTVGWRASRGARTTEEYLLGGRKMNPSAVGLSLFATLVSTVSYLAVPGEIIRHGPVYLAYVAAIPFAYVVTGYVLIPYIMRLPVTSAYEILEGRLGIEVRLAGSLVFLLTRLVWMGLIVFTSSKAMVIMLGLRPGLVMWFSVIMSTVTVVYTSMGGFRASVITGVIQSLILLAGAIISVLYVTLRLGGVGAWWPYHWVGTWDAQPFFSFDPHVRVTVMGMVLTTLVWWICTAGSDQMIIQRYLSTRDAKAARRAFLAGNIADVLLTVVLALLGFALLAFFRQHGGDMSNDVHVTREADYLFPTFIIHFLPSGFGGLLVAALLAAAMSSLSAGLNSCCSVVMVDFVERFRGQRQAGDLRLRTTKLVSTAVGVVVVLLSLLLGRLPGNINELAAKTTNLFVAPLFCLFFMAMFIRCATVTGTILGAAYALWAGVLVGYWDLITGTTALSWQLVLPFSLITGIVAGPLCSLLPMRRRSLVVQTGWILLAIAPALSASLVTLWLRCRVAAMRDVG